MQVDWYHNLVVRVGRHPTKSVALPDWGLSYIELEGEGHDKFQRALIKAGCAIVKVTSQRIYFE